MNFETKNAETHHIPDISRIHALSWKRAYAGIIPKDYLNELKHDAWVPFFNTYLNNGLKAKIICENLKMLGAVSYKKSDDNKFDNFIEVVSLYIDPDEFRNGLGKALLNSVISEAENNNFSGVFLWTLKENKNAQAFYNKMGFSLSCNDEITCSIGGENFINVRYVYKI